MLIGTPSRLRHPAPGTGHFEAHSPLLIELGNRGIGPAEGGLYRAALVADASTIQRSVEASLALERERARAAVREALVTRRAARQDAVRARAAAAAIGPPASSIAALALYTTGFMVIQATEFVLSWTTLPMLIGVRRYSVEGVLLSALPVAALLAIEVVLARTIAAHTGLLAAPEAGRRRLAVAAAGLGCGAALLGLLLLNLGLVDHIALLRELAASASVGDALAIDAATLATGIRVISAAAAIDGAVLLVLLEIERRKRRAASAARRAMHRAVEAHREAIRLAAECRYVARIAGDAMRVASETGHAFLEEVGLRVHQAIERGRPVAPSLEERVGALLRLPSPQA